MARTGVHGTDVPLGANALANAFDARERGVAASSEAEGEEEEKGRQEGAAQSSEESREEEEEEGHKEETPPLETSMITPRERLNEALPRHVKEALCVVRGA